MRQGSCGAAGVSTETVRPLPCLAWPMCSMSMPLACFGAANRRGAAARPAPRPKVFLRKSRLFFMALPLQGVGRTHRPRKLDIGSKRGCTASESTTSRGLGYSAARGKWRNSDAKDGKRCCTDRERSGWSAVQTPRGSEIGVQKLGRTIQDCSGCLDYGHLRNNLPRSVETFRIDTTCLTRLRNHHNAHGHNCGMIHRGMTVRHSRHRIRRRNAMALTRHSGMAFTHECAEPGWSNDPGH